MRVLIAGSSGLIGRELTKQLELRGDQVVRLVRRPVSGANEIEWDPQSNQLSPGALTNIDVVVNLAGASIGKIPWTKKYKTELVESRLNSTKTLARAINETENSVSVFVSASGSGFYGDTRDKTAVETDIMGSGFLAELCGKWEFSAQTVKPTVRLILLRTGIVLAPKEGALSRLLPLIKLGVGGPLGSGKQFWSWITLRDEVRAIIHLIDTPSASGAFNLAAAEAATNQQLVRALANELGRPAMVPAPAFALRLALGEAADELLLCNQRMSSQKLAATGFEFQDANLGSAAHWVVNQ